MNAKTHRKAANQSRSFNASFRFRFDCLQGIEACASHFRCQDGDLAPATPYLLRPRQSLGETVGGNATHSVSGNASRYRNLSTRYFETRASGPGLCGERVGLFIVADAAPQIDDRGDEAHLRNWRFVGTRPWNHVADLIGLALLRPVVEFRAIHLSGSILQDPDIRLQKLLRIVAADGNDLAADEVEAAWIDVAIKEPPSPLLISSTVLALSAFRRNPFLQAWLLHRWRCQIAAQAFRAARRLEQRAAQSSCDPVSFRRPNKKWHQTRGSKTR